jgi:hypothetical protein
LSPQQFVQVTSTKAAKLFSMYPQKGVLAAGSDADVIIFDPSIEHVISSFTHHSRMDTNVYEGFRCRGKVRLVSHHGLQFSTTWACGTVCCRSVLSLLGAMQEVCLWPQTNIPKCCRSERLCSFRGAPEDHKSLLFVQALQQH